MWRREMLNNRRGEIRRINRESRNERGTRQIGGILERLNGLVLENETSHTEEKVQASRIHRVPDREWGLSNRERKSDPPLQVAEEALQVRVHQGSVDGIHIEKDNA